MTQEMAPRLLEALDEPALLLNLSGVVRHANAAALRLLGHGGDRLVGCPLNELSIDTSEAVALLLRRCAGSGQSVVGTLHIRAKDGSVHKCRCRGCRIGGPSDLTEPLLLLRLEDASRERFAVLTEKIVALNAEIRHSKRIQQQLQLALEQKEILLRELHHRVKNNLQVLLGILTIAEQRAAATQAKEVLHEARMRVEAMAVLQRLLYRREDLAGVDGFVFLGELCGNVERAFRRPGITVRVVPTKVFMSLDVAAVAGLIVSELLTNAFKHAFPDREEGEITVELRQEGAETDYMLIVEDNGRGLGPDLTTGTGLTLVHGLARQQGGSCRIEVASGTRYMIGLRDQHQQRPVSPS